MNDLNGLIDATTFGTVRRYLRAAHSPSTAVMVVQHRDALPRVGTALVEDAAGCRGQRERQWTQWLTSGEVRVGGAPNVMGAGADLDAIPDSAICDVLFVPPVYLVHLRGYKLAAQRRADP